MDKRQRKRTCQDLDLVIAVESHLIGLMFREEPCSSRVQADAILEIVDSYLKTGNLPKGKPWEHFNGE